MDLLKEIFDPSEPEFSKGACFCDRQSKAIASKPIPTYENECGFLFLRLMISNNGEILKNGQTEKTENRKKVFSFSLPPACAAAYQQVQGAMKLLQNKMKRAGKKGTADA